MQFLSEPSGGSDVAGALTTAVRDGDEWILNGSKIWTTGAWWSDWGLCLARTNWTCRNTAGRPSSCSPSVSGAWKSIASRCSTAPRSSARSS